MARRQKNMGIAELVLMGANPRRSRNRAEHDARWAAARDILKNGAGARNAKALKRITNAGGSRSGKMKTFRTLAEAQDVVDTLHGWPTARAEKVYDDESASYLYAIKTGTNTYYPEGKTARNSPRVTMKQVREAAADYQNQLRIYGPENMVTQRAEFKYRDLQKAWNERKLFGGLAQNGKKEFRAKRSAWKDALAEGRVVRFDGGDSFRSYPTREQAQAAFEKFRADGLHVDLPAPQQKNFRASELVFHKCDRKVYCAAHAPQPHWNDPTQCLDGWRRPTLKEAEKGCSVCGHRDRRGKNPDATDKAAELFEEFHGKEASEVIELQEADTIRKTYTALGDLVDLTIETPDGKGACIEFKGDGVKVASAPGGKQLYLIGGTQTLDDQLGQFGTDISKDFVELGRAVQITYRARKSMNDFRLVDYYHDLGEESGNPPLAFYDRIRKRIYFTGGSYHVEAPGIID